MLSYHLIGRNLSSIAENIAMGVFLGRKSRRQLVSAYLASNEKRRLREMYAYYAEYEKKCVEEERRLEAVKKQESEMKRNEENKAIHPLDAEKWIRVYRFKHIVLLRTIIRMKLYHTAVCVTGLPVLMMTDYWKTQITDETALTIVGVAFYVFVMTIVLGANCQKAVGILDINENKDKIRVANLSFLGHRIDTMYELSDIMHAADAGQSMAANNIQLVRFSAPKEKQFIFPSYGEANYELLKEIFGELPKPPPRRITKYFGNKKER